MIAQNAARFWIERRQRNASIIMTSSIAETVGIPSLAPYAASKGAVSQLVRTLAAEWAPYGIRVNAIAPGFVENLMTDVERNPAREEYFQRFTPLGRRATIEEIAPAFVFLASPGAWYITGAVLHVDGGYTAV
jgi:NAD(P)-dependent dehydrogenase (short-subunit alcohol dehydrogenase family)